MMMFMFMFFRLRPLDISFMKAVHHKVNIVPVIAKSDTLTLQECQQLKRKVGVSQGGGSKGQVRGWGREMNIREEFVE